MRVACATCTSSCFLETWRSSTLCSDHYVAICFPLHYTSIMSPKLCVCLVVLSW
jgi:olfactory receptor